MTGPAQLVLTASIARRYYLEGRSKVEIAEEFALSRFKVARLLAEARASGLVRIEIGYPGGSIDVELSRRLMTAMDLRHCVVIDSPDGDPDDDPGPLRAHLGEAAAELLGEVLTPDDVLGLSWSRTVSAAATALTRLAPVPVVQLTGALARPVADVSSVDLVRDVAQLSGGPAYFFYAPMALADAATAQALRRQPEVAGALTRIGTVTTALVGVGAWAADQSTLYEATSDAERAEVTGRGACAEVSGVLVDAAGTPLTAELTDRMIGITAAQMTAIPEVIGMAYGTGKVDAVRAVVRGGLVDSLITHSALAVALLEASGGD